MREIIVDGDPVRFADDFEPVDSGAEQLVSQGAESAEALDRISATVCGWTRSHKFRS
jgi:hypothetical protein